MRFARLPVHRGSVSAGLSCRDRLRLGQLIEAGASLSLFAEKRLIELRIPNGKPGDKGAAALLDYGAPGRRHGAVDQPAQA